MMEIEMLEGVMNGLGLMDGKRQMQLSEKKAVRVTRLVLRRLNWFEKSRRMGYISGKFLGKYEKR
ncbi:MAG TPA: hypothetical protein VHT73_13275 [Thermodesulfobacteriota bacterium]|nr:hypothetical protein [Thermodesulfobacteriota bacterium]